MELFEYSPRPGVQPSVKPRIKVVNFGDGYQQRQRDGLNTLLRKYQLVFRGTPEVARDIERFFERHAGVEAFHWIPYDIQEKRIFVCKEWTSTLFSTHTDINCTFEEVVA